MADWITVREAAQILDVHISAIPKMVRRGDLRKRERRPVLNRAEIVAYRDARAAARGPVRQANAAGPRPPDDNHLWLTSSEAGDVMGVGRTAVNARARRGRIPSVLFEGRRWYRQDHLELLLRAEAARRSRSP